MEAELVAVALAMKDVIYCAGMMGAVSYTHLTLPTKA